MSKEGTLLNYQGLKQKMSDATPNSFDAAGLLLAADNAIQNELYEQAGLIENDQFQILMKKLQI
ncbi:MAG: hypothetical protein HY276_05775 [Ignavibacteriales bacterium]|nr:hypothetical protein [Ignavibacteriales bacterium]